MSRPPALRRLASQQGFALLAVLLVLAFVGIIGAEFAYSMRLEASAARTYKETLIASHLAEAGLEQAIRELVGDFAFVGFHEESKLGGKKSDDDKAKEGDVNPDCPLVFYTRERLLLKRLPNRNVPLGGGHFSYCISDEAARLNLNTSPPDRLGRLLQVLGLEREARDGVVDSIQDWRDPNEDHRLNGAESDDTYLKRPVPYRSKNANFDSLSELLQVKGITSKLMDGEDGRPGLASLVTVKGNGQININTVGKEVVRALGLSDAEFSELEQARRQGPYTTVPARFSGRGMTVTSRIFRIEALGLIEGQVRAKITAIVEKRSDSGGEGVAVLEWSGVH
jgi:type II secretory pathway component PulK